MLNYCIFCFSQDFDTFYSATENYGRTNTCLSTNSLVRILKKRIEDFNITTTNTNSEDEGINLVAYSNFSFIKNNDARIELARKIKDLLDEKFKNDDKIFFTLKFYLITSNGEIFLIKQFNKISENIDYFNQVYNEYLLKDFEKYQLENEQREKEIKNSFDKNNLLEFNKAIENIVLSQYVGECLSKVMNKNIDDNQEEFQENMVQDIIASREEEYGDDIRNELDALNKVLSENQMTVENCKIEKCIYNGQDISIEQLVSKLLTHIYPQFLTQINIKDTLDDEYSIETSIGTIKRVKGGKIIINDKIKGGLLHEVQKEASGD